MAVELPTKRMVWRIVLLAIAGTIFVIALVSGGYAVYHNKTTQISDLNQQRQDLRATNATLSSDLAATHIKLRKTNVTLATASTNLTRAKKNLTKMSKDLAAANERADSNYSTGYQAGNSEGYSAGHTSGLVAASDELACSDDADVTWLPACDYYVGD